ncbi:ATP-binding protein [Scytonema sp. PCC 10023]|uniref:ATP-binding protein n=1 Tax=Scytonema sp. PCC 10023 TaxID=1680591 RepID=UPI0039C6D752
MLPKLTQPFYSTKSSGTGLELALVKRIAEVHGGKLLIKSNLMEGTTLSVPLPIIAAYDCSMISLLHLTTSNKL